MYKRQHVQRDFHVEVPLSILFEQQTIAALADYIEQAETSSETVIPKAPALDPVSYTHLEPTRPS
ncbi:phosphopantetheine-binding protein, partial [Bacillus pumilus]